MAMKILPVLLFASFLYTLKRISSCLEDVVSHKNTRYAKGMCVLRLVSHFSKDYSSPLAIGMYEQPCFFPSHPYYIVITTSVYIVHNDTVCVYIKKA